MEGAGTGAGGACFVGADWNIVRVIGCDDENDGKLEAVKIMRRSISVATGKALRNILMLPQSSN